MLKDSDVQQFLQVNRYNDILWFNKESFDELLWWLMLIAAVEVSSDPQRSPAKVMKELQGCYEILQALHEAEKKSAYQVEKMLEAVRKG